MHRQWAASVGTWQRAGISGLLALPLTLACSATSGSGSDPTNSLIVEPGGGGDDASGNGNEGNPAPTIAGGGQNEGSGEGSGETAGPSAPLPTLETPGFNVEPDGLGFGDQNVPSNIGSERLCDGIDENGNGIIDDVDAGGDGLCDCLRIAFLGSVASDAGEETGAFEAWLAERSEVPARYIDASEPLSAAAFENLQVLVVGNLSERAGGGYSATEVAALSEWLQVEGGGMITLAGYTSREEDIVPTVQLLEPTGLSYDYRGRGAGVLGTGTPPVISRGLVAPMHPTMDGLIAMGVYNAYPVIGDGEVLVREGNVNLAMAKNYGEGRVFAFSDEWVTQDSLWFPETRPLTPCQQSCRQCAGECTQCDDQCLECSQQPCSGGQMNLDPATCSRGCDQSCQSCTNRCNTCEAQCEACSELEADEKLDIPRFWLNTLRWLTPANECQVPIPPVIIF